MRAVTTATAAAVLGLPRKSVDSMLSRLSPGILAKGRQGIERRIPVHLLETLALTADLSSSLGLPFKDAFVVAGALLDAPSGTVDAPASAPLGEFAWIHLDRDALRRQIEDRLAVAIESVVRPRRGRPPNRDATD